MQRRTKGSVEAFDVSSFCVQASWLLMSQPASLSELCEALMQPHGGTASPHSKLPQLSPSLRLEAGPLALPNGTQRTPDCTVWSGPASLAFPSPGRVRGGRMGGGGISSSSTGSGLCCDLSLIVFGSKLLAQLTGNKGPSRPFRVSFQVGTFF